MLQVQRIEFHCTSSGAACSLSSRSGVAPVTYSSHTQSQSHQFLISYSSEGRTFDRSQYPHYGIAKLIRQNRKLVLDKCSEIDIMKLRLRNRTITLPPGQLDNDGGGVRSRIGASGMTTRQQSAVVQPGNVI